MSETQNRGLRDFSKYDSMKTEELEEILRLDAEAPVGQESDEELLFYVMGVLADRRKRTEVTGKTALEAYESFKQHYLPEEEKIESAPAAKTRPIRWLRGLAAAAAVLVIVMFGSMTASALGCNVWEIVVTWAQETFHFGDGEQTEASGPQLTDHSQYSSLQEALAMSNRDEKIIPTWIPDGYELDDITIDETPRQKIYVAVYENDGKQLKITIRSYLNNNPEQIEQSEGFQEAYEASGIKYYIFEDNQYLQAAWINGSYECYISGELTIDQLKLMIDSIGKG